MTVSTHLKDGCATVIPYLQLEHRIGRYSVAIEMSAPDQNLISWARVVLDQQPGQHIPPFLLLGTRQDHWLAIAVLDSVVELDRPSPQEINSMSFLSCTA